MTSMVHQKLSRLENDTTETSNIGIRIKNYVSYKTML